jgi:DNA polymerase-3 subunit gamma/tau
MAFSYPSGNGWEIVDITTMTEPQVIAREDSNQWIMASALLVKVATLEPEPTPEPAPEPTPEPEPEQEQE